MKGLLKSKPAWTQFLILVCVTLVSFFVLGLVGTLLLSSLSGIGIKEMDDMSKLDFSQPGTSTFIRGMQVVQFISLFLVPALICGRLFSTNSKQYLGLRRPSHTAYFLAGIGVMLLAIPLSSLLGELNRNVQFPSGIENWMKESEEEASKIIKGLLSKNTIQDLVLNVLCIAGLAAVGEELLFRGMAQRLLIKMFKSAWVGIVIAAFLFSAMHMQFYGFVPRFVLGILLGAIYWYSGSLWVAILAHFLYDAVLIVLAYFNPEMLNDDVPIKLSNIAFLAAVSGLLLVLLLVWMKKRSTTTYNNMYADDAIPVKDDPF